jgi:hypothetical protein
MSPTIDTLINTIILFSTVEFGAFTLIGGLIIAKGIAQDQRAEKTIEVTTQVDWNEGRIG